MTIDWDQVSTALSTEQVESAYEPVGRFTLIHTQFDLLIGRLLLAQAGHSGSVIVEHLVQTIDAINKKRTLDALSGIYGGDPHNIIPDYQPNLSLKKKLKDLSAAFEKASKIRNILAHGSLARYGDRVFVGSVAAPYFFKNTGGAESWVFIDEIDDHVVAMCNAMNGIQALRKDFDKAHERMKADPDMSGIVY